MDALNIHEVLQHLPHRYPFLMIDRVTEFVEGERIQALKNVTYNEPIFTGHFPHHPIFPGVLILEAMAQAAAILAFRSVGESPSEETLYLFVGIDKARFKRPVAPGDQMIFDARIVRSRRGIWQFDAECTVDGKTACSASIMITSSEISS
ncbi:MAG TPA: 3-hydroxyacyl-[acyl-carrier-protein] dehydratase FabZ [Gammaproteobacteria bacterium]|nr:3-hydroxyacyl-[acyl-carrier-protein] dehydratase FabZ [Gammaproteobacteria bacterium]